MSLTPEEVVQALLRHHNVLLYGPPGTGKSHLMREVADRFQAHVSSGDQKILAVETTEENEPIHEAGVNPITSRWVTFHQGYSYEDFIVGMRPISTENHGFSISPKPGVLLEVAAKAATGGYGLLLVDEINRGNTSKIFGEFITLMEPDKRLDESNGETNRTVTITLPYLSPGEDIPINLGPTTHNIPRRFQMPFHVYMLASMNSVDKSVTPLDTALRRRFHVVNLIPSDEGIKSALGLPAASEISSASVSSLNSSSDIALLAALTLKQLNRSIGTFLGRDFQLGPWYFPPLAGFEAADAMSQIAQTWLNKILPQLFELFHGREDQLITVFGEHIIQDAGSGFDIVHPSEEELDAGAAPFIDLTSPPPSTNDVLRFLVKLAGVQNLYDEALAEGASSNSAAQDDGQTGDGETVSS